MLENSREYFTHTSSQHLCAAQSFVKKKISFSIVSAKNIKYSASEYRSMTYIFFVFFAQAQEKVIFPRIFLHAHRMWRCMRLFQDWLAFRNKFWGSYMGDATRQPAGLLKRSAASTVVWSGVIHWHTSFLTIAIKTLLQNPSLQHIICSKTVTGRDVHNSPLYGRAYDCKSCWLILTARTSHPYRPPSVRSWLSGIFSTSVCMAWVTSHPWDSSGPTSS